MLRAFLLAAALSHVSGAALPRCRVFVHAFPAVASETRAGWTLSDAPIGVRAREGMTARTVAGREAPTVRSIASDPVRVRNDRLEMGGIHTRAIATQVIELESFGDRTDEILVHRPMGATRSAADSEVRVALGLRGDLQRKNPALIRSIQKRSYSLLNRNRRLAPGVHGSNIWQ